MAPLTLDEALDLAARNNEVAGVAAARLARAEASSRGVVAGLLPTLAFAGTYTRRAYAASQGSQVFQARDAFGATLVLDAKLFDATAYPALKRSPKLREAVELDTKELRRALSFDVADAFFAALTAESLQTAAERRLKFASETVEDARARVQAGLGDRPSLTRTELEEASAKLSLTQSKVAVASSRNVLGSLIGEELARPLASPAAFRPASAELASDRADLHAQELRAEAAELSKQEPWLRLVPTLGVRATARATNETSFTGRPYDWNIAATLNWMLFDGGLRYADAAARAAEADEAALVTGSIRRAIALELKNARNEVEGASAALVEATARSELAARNAVEVRARFKAGLASALEQADASASEFTASVDEVRQRFAVQRSILALTEALGRWPTDSAPSDRPGAP